MNRWLAVPFGKHSGRTLPWLAFHDPGYVFWCLAKGIFRGALGEQAAEVGAKAKRIKLHHPPGTRLVVDYVPDLDSGKLAEVRFVPDRYLQSGYRRTTLDLSMAFRLGRYDKSGQRILLRAAKQHLFGSPSIRMTAPRCEAFFDGEANFEIE